jgi:serine/threonine protein phosphatase PrpC
MPVTWAVLSHPGLRRPSNEDSYSARPELGLFMVADGMGGHVAGEVASRVAVEAIAGFVGETSLADQNRTWPFSMDPGATVEAHRLTCAFRLANRRIADEMATTESLRGMATTASALLVTDHKATVAHVGDSRVYRLRAGRLEQVTRDHSWVEEQVRAGVMTASDARRHPWRNVVTRALSGGDDPDIDVLETALEPGDRWLLCSDGLFGVVTDERIQELLTGDGPLQAMCQRLVDEANQAGGPDNITTLLLDIDGQ